MSEVAKPSDPIPSAAKLGCGGLYLLFLLGAVLYCASWTSSMSAFSARALEERRLRWEDRRQVDRTQAELTARAGLARFRVEAPRLHATEHHFLLERLAGSLGAAYSYWGGFDWYTVSPGRGRGGVFELVIVGEIVRDLQGRDGWHQIHEAGAPPTYTREAGVKLTTRARVTAEGTELLDPIRVEDVTPPAEPPTHPFELREE